MPRWLEEQRGWAGDFTGMRREADSRSSDIQRMFPWKVSEAYSQGRTGPRL